MTAAGSSLRVVLVPSTPSPTANHHSRRLSQQRFTPAADSSYVHTAGAEPRIVYAQKSPDGPATPLSVVQRSPACARSASMSEALRVASLGPSLATYLLRAMPSPPVLLRPLATDPFDPSDPYDSGKENLSTHGLFSVPKVLAPKPAIGAPLVDVATLAYPEVQEEEEKTCRLCWGDEDDGPLVQPCACRGTAKFIHSHCLEEWRRTSPKEDAAYRCCQCMKGYRDALSLELICAHGSRPSARMARAHSSPGMRSPRS